MRCDMTTLQLHIMGNGPIINDSCVICNLKRIIFCDIRLIEIDLHYKKSAKLQLFTLERIV